MCKGAVDWIEKGARLMRVEGTGEEREEDENREDCHKANGEMVMGIRRGEV